MWGFSYRLFYLAVIGLLLAQGGCRDPKPSDEKIRIGNINNVGMPNPCGCDLQSIEDWETGRSDWNVFVSSHRDAVAWMNINGEDVELRECRTSRPDYLRRGDRFYTDYFVADVWRVHCPDDNHSNHGEYCIYYRHRRYSRNYERDRDFRRPEAYLSRNDSYPEDDLSLRDEPSVRKADRDYGSPEVLGSSDSTSIENRFYGYPGRRPDRYRNPRINLRDYSVRIHYHVVEPCRYEDRGCKWYVNATIRLFRHDNWQDEFKTTGKCRCI
jgi:hypothetical protein